MKANAIALLLTVGLIGCPIVSYAEETDYSKEYSDCIAKDGGTVGTNECNNAARERWDNRLNDAYKKALALYEQAVSDQQECLNQYKQDGSYADQRLVKAAEGQRDAFKTYAQVWVKYRDASCAIEYWKEYPGTVSSNMETSCLLEMTVQRAKELEATAELLNKTAHYCRPHKKTTKRPS
jgi:uncharacterized protein YecT (DUF1311 family)